jgi:hypothetical protein
MVKAKCYQLVCALYASLYCATGAPVPCSLVELYKLESSDWCEQFCVDAKVVQQVKQFGDVEDGLCKENGYTQYNHTADTHSIIYGKVDLYKKDSMRSAAVASVSDIQKDCQAFKPAEELTNSSVTWDPASSSCRFYCEASRSLACMTSPDGINAALQRSGLGSERSTCKKTVKPSEEKPFLVTFTCPEWKMVIDMHGEDRMGAMTVEVDMYKDSVVGVMIKALGAQLATVVV